MWDVPDLRIAQVRLGLFVHGAVRLLTSEHRADDNRVVHRRHAHRAVCQAEVRPVDRDLGVQPYLISGGGDLRVEGERAGAAADGQAAGHPNAPAGGLHGIDGVGDVRVIGANEDPLNLRTGVTHHVQHMEGVLSPDWQHIISAGSRRITTPAPSIPDPDHRSLEAPIRRRYHASLRAASYYRPVASSNL
jgi:hypothetical protein